MHKETKTRSFAKAISNRLINSTATFLIAWGATGDARTSLHIASADIIVKFILFYVNERLWDKISFGRKSIQPCAIWFTGLPLSGKKALADDLSEYLKKKKFEHQVLDGEDVRTLFPLRGFSREERNAYLKRMGYFAELLTRHGVFVVASFISPFRESRAYNRKLIKNYIEIYVSTPQDACEASDEWGLYERAREAKDGNFIGVDDPYEPPEDPDLTIDLSKMSRAQANKAIQKYLATRL